MFVCFTVYLFICPSICCLMSVGCWLLAVSCCSIGLRKTMYIHLNTHTNIQTYICTGMAISVFEHRHELRLSPVGRPYNGGTVRSSSQHVWLVYPCTPIQYKFNNQSVKSAVKQDKRIVIAATTTTTTMTNTRSRQWSTKTPKDQKID